MSLKSIGTAVTSKVGRQILTVQKHSPVLLFGVGVAGFVGTVVLATRSTFKLSGVLDEVEAELESVKNQKTDDENADKKALTKVYVRSAIQVARLYAPAVGLGALTIAALTSSHVILTRRNAAIGAAYAAVQGSFNEYRNRVIDELGAEKDLEFKHGVVIRDVAEDTETGTQVATVKHFDPNGVSGFSRIFDEYNTNWNKSAETNYQFIKVQEIHANNMLQLRGHLFLNDVYRLLGMEDTKAGQIVGWVLDENRRDEKSDGLIDFGLDRPSARDFVNGWERSVVLDFNVDGNILDLI